MAGILPPADVSAGRLFRLLLEKSPRWPLSYRFPLAPNIALYARAMLQSERRALLNAPNQELHLIALSLCDENGDRLLEASDAARLLPNEARAVLAELRLALARIAPRYDVIEREAWWRKLTEGARENYLDAHLLGSCYDVGGHERAVRMIPRPDRYWNMPMSELTDGHWMIFSVCREYLEKKRQEANADG